jgi:hypothetical protein
MTLAEERQASIIASDALEFPRAAAGPQRTEGAQDGAK